MLERGARVQITIDTLKDSKDDIRKAIRMLMALAAEGSPSGNFFDNLPSSGQDAPPPPPVALGGFFDNIEQNPAPAVPEAKKERPRIQLF
jgi:hypothetical protein